MKIVKHVTQVDYTPEEWGLYEDDNAQEAAHLLNVTFENAVNAPDSTLRSVLQAMWPVQRKYADLGAADSEPTQFIEGLLQRIYTI